MATSKTGVSSTPTGFFSASQAGNQTVSAKVRAADPSIILFDDAAYPSIILEKLLFEDIAGQELLSIVRNTDLAGALVSNRIISNSLDLSIKYSPQSIIYIPDSLPNYFKNFGITLFDKLPAKEVGNFNQADSAAPNVFYDSELGTIQIIFKDMDINDQVEIETLVSNETFNDTIDLS